MNNLQVVIAKSGVNYAASKTSATAETATNPIDLADGAIGLFYRDPTTLLWKLVDTSNPSAKTITNIANLYIVRGVPIGKTPITVKVEGLGIEYYFGKAYSDSIKQVSHIGYDGTSGTGIIATALKEYYIGLALQFKTKPPYIPKNTVGIKSLASGNTQYSVSRQLADAINNTPADTPFNTGFPMLAEVVGNNSSVADFTGTATAVQFTKGSKTVNFMIEDATAGWTASTGTVADGDVIGIGHHSFAKVHFTADALGSSAGRHLIMIGNTIYNVADAGTNAQNATAIAVAINAGTQAIAVVTSSTTVTITLRPGYEGTKILVVKSADDSTFSAITLTVDTTIGGTPMNVFHAVGAVSAGATFTLDSPATFSGFWYGGTSAVLNTGIVTANTICGLRLTALNIDQKMDLSILGDGFDDMGVSIYYTTNPQIGSGTAAEVAEQEKNSSYYQGYYHPAHAFPEAPPAYVESTKFYNIITLTHQAFSDDKSGIFGGKLGYQNHTQIMIPTDTDLSATFLTYLNAWTVTSPPRPGSVTF